MNCKENYIKENLIAYIGNKRNILNLIERSIKKTGIIKKSNERSFLDLFAGSGSVSRLAKTMGFEVTTNDWETYSYIINKAFIELDEDFIYNSFIKLGGIENTLRILNTLVEPNEKDAYISKYYCPDNDENPDIKNERMFYTNYNGKKIDSIRAKIEEWKSDKMIDDKEENLLLALLLYEASTRSNTSGVFKAFHKGFGGTNGDALSRILKKIELRIPTLVNGSKCNVYQNDAVKLSKKLKNKKFSIAYLDPPYNQHQYGSNYHLLNTIALNDKPAVNKNIYINGVKINKSAIRKDWTKTKSGFCYKQTALDDFKELISNLNAEHILISYSTDGIIPFNEMLEILNSKGKLDLCLSEHVKYRGGKQALTSQVNNIEFVLIVDTSKKGTQYDIDRVKKILLLNKAQLLIKRTVNTLRMERTGFSFAELAKSANEFEKRFIKRYNDKSIVLSIKDNKICNSELILESLNDFDIKVIIQFYKDIEYITNLTKEDEVYIALDGIMQYYKSENKLKAYEMFKSLPYYISKFNNKKAYLASLKSLLSIFDVIIQTLDVWHELDLLNKSAFKKLEKALLLKLGYEGYKKSFNKNYISISGNSFLNETIENKQDYINAVEKAKERIASLYEYIVNSFTEKSSMDVLIHNNMYFNTQYQYIQQN